MPRPSRQTVAWTAVLLCAAAAAAALIAQAVASRRRERAGATEHPSIATDPRTAQPHLLWLELEMRPPWLTGHTDTVVRIDFNEPANLSLHIPVDAVVEGLDVQ